MKQKKYLLSFVLMVVSSVLFTSCLDSDDDPKTTTVEVPYTRGAFVINNGSWNQNNGSLTYANYETKSAEQLLNGASGLGDTPNDACVMGDTIFVVGTTENIIFMLDKQFRIINQMNTTEEMGVEEGYSPRHIISYNGKCYFTTFGGYAAEMDPKSMTVTRKFKVGSAPEGLTIGGTNAAPVLYVCNSDYGYGNGSISKVELGSATVTEIKNEKIQNPQDVLAIGETLFVLDWGHYTEDYSAQLDAGLYQISGNNVRQLVKDATGMGYGYTYMGSTPVGYQIVTYNAPYGSSSVSYSRFDTVTGNISTLNLWGDGDYKIQSPAAIAVDPLNGYILVASRSLDPETGYASYTLPGFMNMYDSNGSFMTGCHFQTGIEPHMIGFTFGTTTVTY